MESRTTNNDINEIKEVREVFNETRSSLSRKKQRELEKNSIKKRWSIIF